VETVGVDEHLKMMLSNLLTNAVTYSYPGGHVRVECRLDGRRRPVITVADEGIGIPAEKIPHIFQEHYRTNEAVRHNKESSGLGLAIVRHVVEKHRLRLRVKSRVGHGSVFEIEFPPPEELSRPSIAKDKPDGLLADRG
jgi:signal transduction histidine kinase